MVENSKSLALQFDIFVNTTLKFLDTTIEKDYLLKLKIIEELIYKINEFESDKNTIKSSLEAVQEECSKLSYKLKYSARLLDEVQEEKKKLEIEKKTLKSQLSQFYSVFKKPDSVEPLHVQHSNSNYLDCTPVDKKKSHNNTDALLSDLSYSYSEDSSCENVLKNSKPNSALTKKCSINNDLNHINTKTCEIKNLNIKDQQIIATTTITMGLNSVNAKSTIKSNQTPTLKNSLIQTSSDSVESLISSESDKELKPKIFNNDDRNTKKKHNFLKKITVIPEICIQCHKKVKFNNYMVKCSDCKIVAHLECKDLIPVLCSFDLYNIGISNSNEELYSTPPQNRLHTPGSTQRFLSPGLKRRILDSPKKHKAAKQVEFEKQN